VVQQEGRQGQMTLGVALFFGAVFGYVALLLASHLCDYFWQAGIVAGIAFVATVITAYFKLVVPFVIILVLIFVVEIIVLIIRKFR
jgi:hypothetical protein